MPSPAVPRLAAAVAFVFAAASSAQAAPTPVRVHAAPLRAVGTARTARVSGSLLRFAAAPALGAFAVRRLSAGPTLHPLPLVVKPQHVLGVPAFTTPAGVVEALVPLVAGGCAAPPRPGPIATLPAAPFDAMCWRGARDRADDGLPPTSLVAGHDKNALYGPAYGPSHADLR